MTKNSILFFTFSLTFLCSSRLFSQDEVKTSKLKISKIPKDVKFEGKVKNAISWDDKNGQHIILTCETGEFGDTKSEMDDARAAKIYAYHYVISEKSTKLFWKLEDGINDCPVDLNANFIKNTLKVTDLNNDGIHEVWLMYKTACRGDVSPATMKIIMYEGHKKHAMRGENKINISKTETYGGEYKMDKAFKKSPKEFQDYAVKLWNKNILETWGN